jgi:hypothetical protein
MTFLEQCVTAHIERVRRLSQRDPEAGPIRFKPKPKIILIGKDGMPIRPKPIVEIKPPVIKIDTAAPAIPPTVLKHISVERIIRVVVDDFASRNVHVTVAMILSPSRMAWIVRPRQIAVYIARELTRYSLPEIGRRMGGRDHTTILFAYRKIAHLIDKDPELAALINRIMSKLTDRNR